MKRTIVVLGSALLLALGGCSQGNSEDGGNADPAPAPVPTGPASVTVDPSASVAGEENASIEITSCETDDSGRLQVKAYIENTTQENRTYIVTVMALGGNNEALASAALMMDVDAGQTGEATGSSNDGVEGDFECKVAQIDSMPTS